jgi:hypothetical protein
VRFIRDRGGKINKKMEHGAWGDRTIEQLNNRTIEQTNVEVRSVPETLKLWNFETKN